VLDPIRRGQLAAEALGNAALQAGLTQMRADITEMWGQVPMRDVEGREHCWRLFKSMEKFEALLKSYVEAGKADAAMLERKKSPLEVVRGAVGL
jgi:hypothetical protein